VRDLRERPAFGRRSVRYARPRPYPGSRPRKLTAGRSPPSRAPVGACARCARRARGERGRPPPARRTAPRRRTASRSPRDARGELVPQRRRDLLVRPGPGNLAHTAPSPPRPRPAPQGVRGRVPPPDITVRSECVVSVSVSPCRMSPCPMPSQYVSTVWRTVTDNGCRFPQDRSIRSKRTGQARRTVRPAAAAGEGAAGRSGSGGAGGAAGVRPRRRAGPRRRRGRAR